MKNFVQDGNVLTLTAPTGGVLSGAGFVVGGIFAVAATDAIQGASVEGAVVGVFSLPKAAGAINDGDALYWNDTTKVLTTVAGSNLFVGVAVNGGAAADAPTVDCRLSGAPGLAVDAGHTATLADHETRLDALEV